MNKILKKIVILGILLSVSAFTEGKAFAVPDYTRPMPEENGFEHPHPDSAQKMNEHRPPSREEFEKRLNLTEEQKMLARAQREAGIEKIKPIVTRINSKKAEIDKIKMSKMTQQAIDERVAQLESEIKDLRRQAHEIRRENMKAFESSLTEEQRKELQKMKEEGRKRFEKNRQFAK